MFETLKSNPRNDTTAVGYFERELYKIMGRLEALDGGLAHYSDSIIETGKET